MVADDEIYDTSVSINGKRTSFLPAGGLSIDSRTFDYRYRKRVYTGAFAIKQLKRELYLPEALAEGAMRRFLKLTSGNNRGTPFYIYAAIAVLLEANAWDFPVLKREVLSILEIDHRKFFKARRRLGITFTDYSPNRLAWKYMVEKNLPQSIWSEILTWMTRVQSNSKKSTAATAVYLATRKLENRESIETISTWFETTKSSMNRLLAKLRKNYSI